ncbi:hypothetical protein Sjap_020479 [Stephania japonica]|uniref:Uncharacterized protein n=1 Tax=Stephania japonica TaxID=461633 RepID=A0AAP0F0Q6_9MAGN
MTSGLDGVLGGMKLRALFRSRALLRVCAKWPTFAFTTLVPSLALSLLSPGEAWSRSNLFFEGLLNEVCPPSMMAFIFAIKCLG